MAMRFTTKSNKALFIISAIGTCSFGIVRPAFGIFIGRMSDGVGSAGSEAGFNQLSNSARNMIFLGIYGGIM